MQIDVHNTSLEKVGTTELPEEIFSADHKPALLWEQVKAQRASKRSGTHATKDVGQVSGTGAKPFRQKGTGNARQGSRRAPQFVGGGKTMTPRPRDYSYRLPRSARKAALRGALSVRAADKNLLLLDKFELEAPKTKEVNAFLSRLGTKSALIVDVENGNLKLSARNLPRTKYLVAEALNVYDILDHEKLVITKAALEAIIRKAKKSDDASADDAAAA